MADHQPIDPKVSCPDDTLKDHGPGDVYVQSLTLEEDKRILRRIDLYLLPMMAVSYMFQFLDKSAMSFTSILGLTEDLHLQGEDYSWASSVYYFGYLAASYVAAVLLVRFSVGKLISTSIIVWGAVLMLTATASNAQGLIAVRFFLGATEAAIAPGLSIVVSMWYKRSEQPFRHGIWFQGITIAGIFGGLVAYGIGHVQSIAPWKAVFLIFGAITLVWAFVLFYWLPDTPMNARFLSEEDRRKAITRVQENMTGIKNDEFKIHQFAEALLDLKCWALVLIQIAGSIPNGGVSNFGSIIIEGFGFSTLNTLLVQIITYVVQGVLVYLSTAGCSWFENSRTYWMVWNSALSIVGAAMARQISPENVWARFIGYCLAGAYAVNFPLTLSMSTGNIGGFTKKTTVNAMVFIGYCAGNIIGPHLFFSDEEPSYPSGFLAMLICFVISLVLSLSLRYYLIWENKRRDRLGHVDSGGSFESLDATILDKTDKELLQFRYVY
ncbi:major facilitator superfamily domain-containing protein [Aspergillus bertholletiae]|uniref:Major facilitator superfamily domain-containing protein n=1 Tax=Aspergillus bertholletiae TaxID=1226010 RepID=A0A5N7B4D1_9EURO|nr:major facilitator superfamily domain-containing protein [Aspergillus bertholletiae]